MVADTSALVAVLQETNGSAFEQKLLHPARLNFGDCFSYALAKQIGEPLLFKGNDFVHTDVLKA